MAPYPPSPPPDSWLLSDRITGPCTVSLCGPFPGPAFAACFSGQSEIERGPSFDLAFRPDASAMPSNDSFDGGQTDARAFEFRFLVQPLKRMEEACRVPHIESGAVVAEEIHLSFRPAFQAELDSCGGMLARELPRVFQEVLQRGAHQR